MISDETVETILEMAGGFPCPSPGCCGRTIKLVLPLREIAEATGVSHTTVRRVIQEAESKGGNKPRKKGARKRRCPGCGGKLAIGRENCGVCEARAFIRNRLGRPAYA